MTYPNSRDTFLCSTRTFFQHSTGTPLGINFLKGRMKFLKGQSHEKVCEIMTWNISFSRN
jgi:hypothetical protein